MNGTAKQVAWAEKIKTQYEASVAEITKMANGNAKGLEFIGMVKAQYEAMINPGEAVCWIDLDCWVGGSCFRDDVTSLAHGKPMRITQAQKLFAKAWWAKK